MKKSRLKKWLCSALACSLLIPGSFLFLKAQALTESEALAKWSTFDPAYYPTLEKGAGDVLIAKCQKSANTSILYYADAITPIGFNSQITIDHISEDGWFGIGLSNLKGNSVVDPASGGKGFLIMFKKSATQAGKADITLFTVNTGFDGPFGGVALGQVDIGTAFKFEVADGGANGYTLKVNDTVLAAADGTVPPDLSSIKTAYESGDVFFRLAGCGNGAPGAEGSDSAEFTVNQINGVAPFADVTSGDTSSNPPSETTDPNAPKILKGWSFNRGSGEIEFGDDGEIILNPPLDITYGSAATYTKQFALDGLTFEFQPELSNKNFPWVAFALRSTDPATAERRGGTNEGLPDIAQPNGDGIWVMMRFDSEAMSKMNVYIYSIDSNMGDNGSFGGIQATGTAVMIAPDTKIKVQVRKAATKGYSIYINDEIMYDLAGEPFVFSYLQDYFPEGKAYLSIGSCRSDETQTARYTIFTVNGKAAASEEDLTDMPVVSESSEISSDESESMTSISNIQSTEETVSRENSVNKTGVTNYMLLCLLLGAAAICVITIVKKKDIEV